MIEFSEFSQLATQGNFIPVTQEWTADLETPVSAWFKVCSGQPYSFLLESVEGGENLGRYSFLGCDPMWVLENCGETTIKRDRAGNETIYKGNPFTVLKDCLASINPVKLNHLPPAIGGLFGMWGYELINWIEPRVPIHSREENDLPDGVWMQVDQLLIFDQVKRKIWAIAYADLREETNLETAYKKACDKVKKLVAKLQSPLPDIATTVSLSASPTTDQTSYESTTTQDDFCRSVEKAKHYIHEGDIFQVVLSQRLKTTYTGHPFNLYRSLRIVNPSPYMAYYQFGDWQLIGSSPEVMVKVEETAEGKQQATLRPIAGTRKRGNTPAEDAALAEDLLQDSKELAEHIMLVDLGRNDLGRVCQQGSVTVDQLMTIEQYSHVMHIVSNVIGEVADEKTAWDVLQATFPAGTVSGAPKIRAMEIIAELEPHRRGPYSGVYGYYDFEGQLNSAIAIRTMIVRPEGDNKHSVAVQAGAGVVADSIPEKEYEETLNKAKGLFVAISSLQ